jgi:alanine dehydrogenase
MILITEDHVKQLVGIQDALAAVESSFLEQSSGTGYNLPRQRVRQPKGTLHIMGAALSRRGYWGYKAYTVTSGTARFSVNLYDISSGELLTIIEADMLGQLRTGAASAIATRSLARPDAQVMALFGCGYQAETQLEAISQVAHLKEVRVYSRSAEHRDIFAARMGDRLGLNVFPVESSTNAIENADIITTITNSRTPVFEGSELLKGVHINAAGSNAVIRAELDVETIRKVDLFFTDDLEQARLESGNLVQAFERNAFHWSQLHQLADLVAGKLSGRQWEDEITLFESHGIALWDIALAADIYEKAHSSGIGTEIDFLR